MREAVHQALHVQRIDQADSAHPEETHPAETENQADADREDNDRRFGPAPDLVDAAGQFRCPALLVGGLGLIEPAKMRPPEATPPGTGAIPRRVRAGTKEARLGGP